MKRLSLAIITTVSILFLGEAQAHDRHAPLNSEQRVFMKQYEIARSALALGDLQQAKNATAKVAALTVIHHESSGVDAPPGFVQDARKFMAATSIAEAREIFVSYSKRAVNVADLKSGFFVVKCSAAADHERDWVQPTPLIGNPFVGGSKPCGDTPDL